MDENLPPGEQQPPQSSAHYFSSERPPQSPPPISNPPPPVTPPPPIMAAAPAPAPRRGGRGWKFLALVLLCLLALSVLFNMKFFTRRVLGSGKTVHHKRQYVEEITLQDNGARTKIAVIEIEGVISSADNRNKGDNMVDFVREQLKTAQDDPNVRSVILKVNSPGGEVLASDEIYRAIVDFQRESKKPVIASMQTLAASGGYYVSAPCRWIVANDMTLTGSIGVIMHGFNVSGLMEKIGVRNETYKSGKFKDMLSPFRRPEDKPPGEDDMMHELIMETYETFTNVVYLGRTASFKLNGNKGQELQEDWADYADGRVLSGRQAYELGFVDELGNFETAVERAKSLAGISNANLIQYQQPFGFGDLFRIFGQAEPGTVKVDIGLNAPKMQAGCLYFLYERAVP